MILSTLIAEAYVPKKELLQVAKAVLVAQDILEESWDEKTRKYNESHLSAAIKAVAECQDTEGAWPGIIFEWNSIYWNEIQDWAKEYIEKNDPKVLSEWLVLDGHCAVRIREGGNIENPDDRVALIEKSPRIRFQDTGDNQKDWKFGPKGSGGSDGHLPENELYGFYQPSREWCDEELRKLGYILK